MSGPATQIRRALAGVRNNDPLAAAMQEQREAEARQEEEEEEEEPVMIASASSREFWRHTEVRPNVHLRWYSVPIENSTFNVQLQQVTAPRHRFLQYSL